MLLLQQENLLVPENQTVPFLIDINFVCFSFCFNKLLRGWPILLELKDLQKILTV